MKHLIFVFGLLAVVLSPFTNAQITSTKTVESCYAEQVIGFERRGNQWVQVKHDLSMAFEVKEDGRVVMNLNGNPQFFTHAEFGNTYIQNEGEGFEKFMLSTKTGNFTASFLGGYINHNQAQVPWLAVGSCS